MAVQFIFSYWYHTAYEETNFEALRKEKVYLWPTLVCKFMLKLKLSVIQINNNDFTYFPTWTNIQNLIVIDRIM